MKNEKYLVIEKAILERLLKEMETDLRYTGVLTYAKWVEGNINALKTVKDYCKPLDETI
jgi:hypothetical protein